MATSQVKMKRQETRKTNCQYNNNNYSHQHHHHHHHLYPDSLPSKTYATKYNVISTSSSLIKTVQYLSASLLLIYLISFSYMTNVQCQQQNHEQQQQHQPHQTHTNDIRTKRWLVATGEADDNNNKKILNPSKQESNHPTNDDRQKAWQSSQIPKIAGRVVVYQVRFIAPKTGRTDYAIAGESIELSCHYIMKDEDEDVKQLVWSKDGENFLRWRKNKPGLEVLSYTFKGHIDPTSTRSHIIIHNTTIEMHGKYKCSIKTDLGQHEMDQDVVIISRSACKLNDWRIVSQPGECRELFRLDCRNMFPRPVPSCGLWNGKLDKFIRSVAVDISEEPNKLTYRVRYSDKFDLRQPSASSSSIDGASGASNKNYSPKAGVAEATRSTTTTTTTATLDNDHDRIVVQSSASIATTVPPSVDIISNSSSVFSNIRNNATKTKNNIINNNENLNIDLLQYAGHLVFKCDIIVPETSWKLSLSHKMFDFNDGCLQDPLETIERMRSNYSHYVASRMQEAGYLVDRQLNDFEMLSSSLNYELLPSPPSHLAPGAHRGEHSLLSIKQQQQQHLQLNCWQKPRFGSLARLSCANKQTSSTHQVKLLGANLLECQSTGNWVPISSSQLDRTHHNKHKSTTNRNHNNIYNKRRELSSSSSGSKSTSSLPPANDLAPPHSAAIVDNSSLINKKELTTRPGQAQPNIVFTTEISSSSSTTTTTKDEDYVNANEYSLASAGDSNDLEEFSTLPTSSQTEAQPDPETIPTTEINLEAVTAENPLTPSQIGHLLPTCVSLRPRSRVKLPLRVLESMQQNNNQHQHHAHPKKQQHSPGRHTQEDKGFFSFSSSASSSRFCLPIGCLTGHMMMILLLTLVTSTRLSSLHQHSYQITSHCSTVNCI